MTTSSEDGDEDVLLIALRSKIGKDIAPTHYCFIVYSGRFGASANLTRRFDEQHFSIDRINVRWLNRKFGALKGILDEVDVSSRDIANGETREALRRLLMESSNEIEWGEDFANVHSGPPINADEMARVRLDLCSLFWHNFHTASRHWFDEPLDDLARVFDRAVVNESLCLVPRARTNFAAERADEFIVRLTLLFFLHNVDAHSHVACVQFGIFLLACLNMELVEFDCLLGLDARLVYIALQRASVSIRYLQKTRQNVRLHDFRAANVDLRDAVDRHGLMQRATGENFERLLSVGRDMSETRPTKSSVARDAGRLDGDNLDLSGTRDGVVDGEKYNRTIVRLRNTLLCVRSRDYMPLRVRRNATLMSLGHWRLARLCTPNGTCYELYDRLNVPIEPPEMFSAVDHLNVTKGAGLRSVAPCDTLAACPYGWSMDRESSPRSATATIIPGAFYSIFPMPRCSMLWRSSARVTSRSGSLFFVPRTANFV